MRPYIDHAIFYRGFHISTTRKSHRRNTSYGSDSGARYEYLICAFKSYHLVCRSPRNSQTRITLPSGVYLELLQLGYFAIFNGLVVFLYVFVTLLTVLQLSTRNFASCSLPTCLPFLFPQIFLTFTAFPPGIQVLVFN